MRNIVTAALAVMLLMGGATAQTKMPSVSTPFFGNALCPVTGEKVDQRFGVPYKGQKIFVCCRDCVKKVKANPAKFFDKAYPKDKIVDLKNANCPIRGGKAKKDVSAVFQGRRVHFCCPGCDKAFMKEPNKQLAMLTRKGLKEVNNKKCPVMGEAVEPDSFLIYGDKIVNICCPGCVDKFKKDPARYMKSLGTGKSPGHGREHGNGGG